MSVFRFLSKHTLVFLCVFYLVGFAGENAYAYIDPASGSYIFQLIVAGLLGGLYALKIYWKSLKSFLSSIFNKNKSTSDDPNK